jgi:DNA ligase (NAD+)
MGLGVCEGLLKQYSLNKDSDDYIFKKEEPIEIKNVIVGKTAKTIFDNLKTIKPNFEKTLALGFNLVSTKENMAKSDSPISGKLLVFTGTMRNAKREDLIKQAKQLGAEVGSSISNKTDYLIAGDNVGVTKVNDANKKGVKVITEDEYFSLLSNQG